MGNKYTRFRILLVGAFFLISFLAIAAKAIHLQVYRSPWLSQKASDQYEQSSTTSGKRGIIYDRNLREMAVSIDVTSVAASAPAERHQVHRQSAGRHLKFGCPQNPT